jgi:hypothetical protein
MKLNFPMPSDLISKVEADGGSFGIDLSAKQAMAQDIISLHIRMQELEKALREIAAGISYCICDAYRSRGEGEIICNKCIAKKALEGK